MFCHCSLLHRVRELITALRPVEVEVLEKMLMSEESVHSSHSPSEQTLEQSVLNKDEKHLSLKSERAGIKHRRRHSDPTSRRSHCYKDDSLPTETSTMNESMRMSSLRQSMSTLSLVPAIIDPSITGDHAKNNPDCAADRKSVQCRSGSNCRRMSAQAALATTTTTSTSCHSIDTSCSTSSTMDSFELALAVAAKSSPFISPGTRQLLHRLFITIAGKRMF